MGVRGMLFMSLDELFDGVVIWQLEFEMAMEALDKRFKRRKQ